MTYDFSSVVQKPNLWYSTTCIYEGEGQAEFENPHGKVWGHTNATFEENGQFKIVMTVEGYESDIDLPLGLHQLLSADEPILDGGELKLFIPPIHPNTCKHIEIRTPDGLFIGENVIDVNWSFNANPEGTTDKLTFHPRKMLFDGNSSNPAMYWAVPLVNFVADCIRHDETIGTHPLRIFPDCSVTDDVPEDKKAIAEFISKQESRLIVFNYKSGKGFIEGLPDYKERVSKLTSRQLPHAITAIMVVPVDGKPVIPVDEVVKWFPRYLIDLLEISTGTEIEAPWIEFRDLNGDLVRRVHLLTKPPLFFQGVKILDELFVAKGIGKLLESSQDSPNVRETFFRVALRHTVLAGKNEQILEDKLDHLCRALETLCDHYGFKTQYLLPQISDPDKTTIKQELARVDKLIDSLRENAIAKGEMEQANLLETIRGRINNVANLDRKFGLAVCDLLSKFGLFDADVIDGYYSREPRNDGRRTWADVITRYRGSVIHSGFFKLQSGDMQVHDIVIIVRHLHDILVRIIFLLADYKGDYLPETIGGNATRPVLWVQKDTPVELLGYKKQKQSPMMTVSVTKE